MVGLLEIDPVVSIDFDLAIMMRGCQHENEQVEKYRHRGPGAGLSRYKERVEAGKVKILPAEEITL